jgi:beta-mannosidase
MIQHSLNSRWSFREASGTTWYPAQVPGCVHTDLLNNSQIPDPFIGTNEVNLQWVGEKDWVYQSEFDLPPGLLDHECLEMVFTGLDTYASVVLNGRALLDANNMFREWRVDCREYLRERGNHLSVTFRNVFGEDLAKSRSAPFRLRAFENNDQSNDRIVMYARKAQFHYGWDWGPRLITCGIWRPVHLEAWDGARIQGVRVQQTNVSAGAADITSFIEILATGPHMAQVVVSLEGSTLGTAEVSLQKGLNRVHVEGRILNPRLWWTNGLGKQELYRYSAAVILDDKSREEYVISIGIRALEIVREKDRAGMSFFVRLNGVPVFMKGANFIPLDSFQNRVSPERYEHAIRSAELANMNMLRAWGGGIYEDDRFYELCDRYGILVWQDMMFACAMYPANDEFLDNVRREVADNVRRICNHPSLALYCGNNENEIGWHTWGWKEQYPREVQEIYERNMHTLFNEVIRDAVREADPTRYYHPSSPSAGIRDNDTGSGDIHYWGVWHKKEPFESYNTNIARFVSEYGFQSYPELATVEKFTRPEDRDIHSKVMLAHQKCVGDQGRDHEYANGLIQVMMERYFRMPKDFTSYLYVGQLLQAEGMQKAIEAHRRNMPFCMGSLYWQLNDCWPVASWSSIDYYGNWKALHYVARRVYAPVVLIPVYNNDRIEFQVVSDRLQSVDAVLEIAVRDFGGQTVFGRSLPAGVAPNSSTQYPGFTKVELTSGRDPRQLVLIARLLDKGAVIAEHVSHFVYPKDLDLPDPQVRMTTRRITDAYAVCLSSDAFAKSVFVRCEGEDEMFSDNYFDLLPGEDRTVTFPAVRVIPGFEKKLRVISLVDAY